MIRSRCVYSLPPSLPRRLRRPPPHLTLSISPTFSIVFHSIMQCLDVCYKEPFITSFYKQELAAKKALDLVRHMPRCISSHTHEAGGRRLSPKPPRTTLRLCPVSLCPVSCAVCACVCVCVCYTVSAVPHALAASPNIPPAAVSVARMFTCPLRPVPIPALF